MSGSRRVSSTRWALSSCHHHHHYCSIHLLIPSLLGHTTITTGTAVIIINVVMFIITIIIAVPICLSHLSAEPFSDCLSPLGAEPHICFQSGSTATPSPVHCICPLLLLPISIAHQTFSCSLMMEFRHLDISYFVNFGATSGFFVDNCLLRLLSV